LRKKIIIPVIIIILIIIGFLTISSPYYYRAEPTEFVKDRQYEVDEGLFYTYEITRYQSDVEITDLLTENISIGVTVDPINLNFGKIPIGGSYGTRFLDLVNLQEQRAKVMIKAFGNTSSMVTFSHNNFVLDGLKNLTVEITLTTTNTTKIGNYTGEIDVIIIRPKYDFLYYFF
jgi:hypothetical protein